MTSTREKIEALPYSTTRRGYALALADAIDALRADLDRLQLETEAGWSEFRAVQATPPDIGHDWTQAESDATTDNWHCRKCHVNISVPRGMVPEGDGVCVADRDDSQYSTHDEREALNRAIRRSAKVINPTVTPVMVEAGLKTWQQCDPAMDLSNVMGVVYRAMHAARDA